MKSSNKKQKNSIYVKFFKRFIDIAVSLTAIIILSPILLLLYILNGIFVGFPTIFKQPRPGKDNKIFYIYKFRSMNNKKDKDGNLLPDSQRITFWGKIMRKTSLDELPQLFNVLKGDMSLVGPRPIVDKEIPKYGKFIREYFLVPPGITGMWQVSGRSDTTYEERVAMDTWYVRNWSVWIDILYLFKTVKAVATGKGAY